MPTPTSIPQSIVSSAHKHPARPPAESHPLFRDAAPTAQPRRRADPDLRLAIRLAAVTALIAAGIGLGHGISASSDSLSDSSPPVTSSAVDRLAVTTAVQTALGHAR